MGAVGRPFTSFVCSYHSFILCFFLMVISSGFIFPILSRFVAILLPFSFVFAVLALPMPMPPIRRCSTDGVPALFPCNPSRESGRLVFVCAGDLSLGCEQFDGQFFCCAPKLEKAPLEMLQKIVRVEERRETQRIEKELPLFVSRTTTNASPATTTAKTATTMAFEGAMAMPTATNSVPKSATISTAPAQGSAAASTSSLITLMTTNLSSLPLSLPLSPEVSFVVRSSSSGTISGHNGKTNDGTAKAEQKQKHQMEGRSRNTTREEGRKSTEKAMEKTEKGKTKTTTKLVITISANDNGTLENGDKGNGTLINGAKDNGTLINGASNATLENGTKGNDTSGNCAKGNDTLINCASNATLENGTKGNGTSGNCAKGNGTLINGAKGNGTLINGAKDNGILINDASNATLENGTKRNGSSVNCVNGNGTFGNCANLSANTERGICAGSYILANTTKENDILRNGTKDKDNGTYTDNEIFMNGTIANGTLENYSAKGNDTLINGGTTTTVLPSKIMGKSAVSTPTNGTTKTTPNEAISKGNNSSFGTSSTSPTAFAVTAPCIDLVPQCWWSSKLCNNPRYSRLVRLQCPKTCDRCKANGMDKAVGDSSMGMQCFDKGKDCPRIAFLCRTIAYSALMANECAKTCGQCDGGATEEGEKAAKMVEKERGKPKSSGDRQKCEAKDNYLRCAVWRLQGFCTSPKYSKYLKSRYCAKTCAICEGGDDEGSGRK